MKFKWVSRRRNISCITIILLGWSFTPKGKIRFTVQAENRRAVTCFLMEYCGFCKKDCLTYTTLKSVFVAPEHIASTAEAVRLSCSSRCKIGCWSETAYCRPKLRIYGNRHSVCQEGFPSQWNIFTCFPFKERKIYVGLVFHLQSKPDAL